MIPADAFVASTAIVSGEVRIGSRCVVDHGATIVASGSPIELGAEVVILPGSVVRSTGGAGRPAHPVRIGEESLIGPQAVLTGCEIGRAVYVATQVMVFHGAIVGDGCRLGAGSIVHTNAILSPGSHVGMRQYAVASPDDGPSIVTGDLDEARDFLRQADFFKRGLCRHRAEQLDLVDLHRKAARTVAAEIRQRDGNSPPDFVVSADAPASDRR